MKRGGDERDHAHAQSSRQAHSQTTIERLINMLDDLEPDADFEPSLGWTERGSDALANGLQDDREQEVTDEPHDGDELELDPYEFGDFGFIWGGGEDAPRNDSGF